jgi:transcription elongation factor GreA-like protein
MRIVKELQIKQQIHKNVVVIRLNKYCDERNVEDMLSKSNSFGSSSSLFVVQQINQYIHMHGHYFETKEEKPFGQIFSVCVEILPAWWADKRHGEGVASKDRDST